eukprot:12195318-Karenia_brevis.AAC.1
MEEDPDRSGILVRNTLRSAGDTNSTEEQSSRNSRHEEFQNCEHGMDREEEHEHESMKLASSNSSRKLA